MVVDIEKVVVRDRIRKDFGNIQELADDIRQNGLINPPVVNKDYELLAGERRLMACKSLGWSQIEVRMMDTRDVEHELNVEISENDVRKGFTKSERVDYMKRLLRIEQAKAKERQNLGEKIPEGGGRAKDKTAIQFGVSSKTMEKEMTIVENRDLLDPSDFADWDEGKLSTNKAFLKVKNRQKELEEENRKLREAISSQGAENVRLKMELEKAPAREIVKEVTVEVVPDDYEHIKKSNADLRSEISVLGKDRKNAIERCRAAEEELDSLKKKMNEPEEKAKYETRLNCFAFCAGVKNFLEKYGGYKFRKDEISAMPEIDRNAYEHAIKEMRKWLDEMLDEVTVEV